ncbi:MAG: hypothetical protein NZT61_07100 [Deltaproteobacteria bacterium]|nr:hypothetical protein [Deltaproteobacteria bacterium]
MPLSGKTAFVESFKQIISKQENLRKLCVSLAVAGALILPFTVLTCVRSLDNSMSIKANLLSPESANSLNKFRKELDTAFQKIDDHQALKAYYKIVRYLASRRAEDFDQTGLDASVVKAFLREAKENTPQNKEEVKRRFFELVRRIYENTESNDPTGKTIGDNQRKKWGSIMLDIVNSER